MRLKIKIIYLILIAVMTASIGIVSCASNQDNDLSKTGAIDQNGNIITITNIITKTNTVNITNRDYITPDNLSDYYRIYVPYGVGGDGHVTVSYKDTNKLNQLWLDQIKRKAVGDGKVFAIRNKANDRNANNFQFTYNGRQDYYYFKDNGDIVYKGGDVKNPKDNEYLVKRFIGAVMVDYRTVTERTSFDNYYKPDEIARTGQLTIGAIYKMAIGVNEAKSLFANDNWSTTGSCDGVYDFIAARKWIWFFYNDFVQDRVVYNRRFYDTNFLEVLVLNPHANEGNAQCLGVDAYYYYPPEAYREGENTKPPINGFTPKNMPYMTNENIYLGDRPEWYIQFLTHTTTFTDASRNWKYLAMPGRPEGGGSTGGTTERNTGGRLPRW